MLLLLCAPQRNSFASHTAKRVNYTFSILSRFLPSAMAETKAHNEVFHYLRDNEYLIDFSKIRKEIHLRKSNNSFWKMVRCFSQAIKTVSLKDGFTAETSSSRSLKACHFDKLAGHFGRDMTREKVCTRRCLEFGVWSLEPFKDLDSRFDPSSIALTKRSRTLSNSTCVSPIFFFFRFQVFS